MGILNVTPDSFSDGGHFLACDTAIEHGRQLAEQGADIIDIGGESTRPGAQAVGVQEELDRVLPVLEALIDTGIPLSIDTQKPEVMRAAIAAGAAMINDINALQDEDAMPIVAQSNVAVCLMHKQGTPSTMQLNPVYTDVVSEVHDFLLQHAHRCEAAGIDRQRIVIDPGFGFGKTLEHNFALLKKLDRLVNSGYPVLAGFSRKASLGIVTGRPVDQRMAASLTVAILAAQQGAAIVRVHDVKETRDAFRILQMVHG